MPANLAFVAPGTDEEIPPPSLGEVELSDQLTEGRPVLYEVKNSGDTVLRDVIVRVDGEGSKFVEIAPNTSDGPSGWESGPLNVHPGSLFAGERFGFWARAKFSLEDREGDYAFEYVFNAKSTG